MVQTAPLPPPGLHAPRLLVALAAVLATVILTSGCVYRVAVQQGNFLDPRQVSQLQDGMTRSQVRFLLGTPMLPDAFDNDRWDYVYYLKMGRGGETEQRRLTVFFTDDRVARIENVGVESIAVTDPAAPQTPAPSPPAAAESPAT
jgi:outer membrane protein assembly factor BamE